MEAFHTKARTWIILELNGPARLPRALQDRHGRHEGHPARGEAEVLLGWSLPAGDVGFTLKSRANTIRAIRGVIRRAAHESTPKGERAICERLAKKLMRQHKIAEADIWANEPKPGTKKIRVPVNLAGGGEDRATFTTKIVMTRYPSVTIACWLSSVTKDRGAMEFTSCDNHLDDAVEFWKAIDGQLKDGWTHVQKVAPQIMRTTSIGGLVALLQGLADGTGLDGWSWLFGVSEGFEAQENLMGHKTREHPDFVAVDNKPAPLLLKAKKKRRRLVKANPFGMMLWDERMQPDYRPPEPAQTKPRHETIYALEPVKQSVPETIMPKHETQPPKPETPAKQVDKHSFDLGFMGGRKLAARFPRKE